jgi:lipopolysaccharide/colanic/teichoic acid biosynthesis glycosyltransferase
MQRRFVSRCCADAYPPHDRLTQRAPDLRPSGVVSSCPPVSRRRITLAVGLPKQCQTRFMRRLIDVIFAMLWLIITAPLFILIAILIKIDSAGSIFYSPRMIGKDGKEFILLRFRTMSTDISRSDDEQRFTRVGRVIRNYSLDHLPMLINLLKGDLTIIGPRPMETNVVNLQDSIWQQYFQSKPGVFNYAILKLGNLWTSARVSNPARNQELELEYYQKQSPAFDLQLFLHFLYELIESKGNVKARGNPDSEEENRRHNT